MFSDHNQQNFDRIMAGQNAQWNCLADYYELVSLEGRTWHNGGWYWGVAEFEGIYDLDILADVFSQIADVESISPNYIMTIGSPSTICVQRDGEQFYYAFRNTCGFLEECVAGYYYFSTTPAGHVTGGGIYEGRFDSPHHPAWTEIFSSSCIWW
jgi:hypothetical protein